MPKIRKGPTITTQTKIYKGITYKYKIMSLMLRADKGPMVKAISEMRKLGLDGPKYFRMLLAERFGETDAEDDK